ncbi:hypothetical protein WISP_00013 [Willisornis vidua]|uniref:Uncharacterized protein n=1 Tax=Willisornis vidua TaxID=1566151 RepID=A0ABQ9CNF9_9PASS|nr:hypothetical protein WISP_00013 [Willisornis vidua]
MSVGSCKECWAWKFISCKVLLGVIVKTASGDSKIIIMTTKTSSWNGFDGDEQQLKPACSAAKGKHVEPRDRSPGVNHREQDCSKTPLRKGENIREEEKTSKAPHGEEEESCKLPLREDKYSMKEKRAAKKPGVVNWTLVKRVEYTMDNY